MSESLSEERIDARLPSSLRPAHGLWERHGRSLQSSLAARFAPLFVTATVIAVLQVSSGTYRAELSTPDESAHFVTALMIRDYIVGGFATSPMAFATNYYIHYPKVAFGSWPPLFHVLQAACLLVWPAKASVLVLLACISCAVAMTLYYTARRRWGPVAGLCLALFLVAMPLSQYLASEVLADGLIGLFDLWAILLLARYLETRRTRDALWFGLLAGLSMLTKQNGAALLLVPFIAVPLSGRWDLFRRRAFWAALTVAVLIGGPFIAYSARIFVGTDPAGSSFAHFVAYSRLMASETGPAVWPFAILGSALLLVRRVRGPIDGYWAVMIALPTAIVVFHSLTPNVPGSRYLWAAFPSVLLLAAYAMESIVRRVSRSPRGAVWYAVAFVFAIAVAFGTTTFAMPKKPHYGFDAIAEMLASRTDCTDCVVMVSSRTGRDGPFIAEVATRDRRPQHVVLRADKLLSGSDWVGSRYELLYSSPERD